MSEERGVLYVASASVRPEPSKVHEVYYSDDEPLTPDDQKLIDAAWEAHKSARPVSSAHYGIIDPDYARVFTVARCIAWSEGYALVMHGSFTRDLDLVALPWADTATDAEHLVKRISLALDDLNLLVKDASGKTASEKPHGRLAWTLTFKTFGDPRFIDLSVMPRKLADANTKKETP